MLYAPREAAAKTGFSLDTLRYYERIGLLDDIERNATGQRVFSDDDLAWLGVLRCLRDTGMPIARMRRYAELARGGDETVAERKALLEEHDQSIEQRIAELREEQVRIREKLAFYDGELARLAAGGFDLERAPAPTVGITSEGDGKRERDAHCATGQHR